MQCFYANILLFGVTLLRFLLRDLFEITPAAPSVPDSFLLSDCFFWGGFVI